MKSRLFCIAKATDFFIFVDTSSSRFYMNSLFAHYIIDDSARLIFNPTDENKSL